MLKKKKWDSFAQKTWAIFFEQKCTYSFAQNVSLPNQNFVLQNFELQNLQDFVLQIQSCKVLI